MQKITHAARGSFSVVLHMMQFCFGLFLSRPLSLSFSIAHLCLEAVARLSLLAWRPFKFITLRFRKLSGCVWFMYVYIILMLCSLFHCYGCCCRCCCCVAVFPVLFIIIIIVMIILMKSFPLMSLIYFFSLSLFSRSAFVLHPTVSSIQINWKCVRSSFRRNPKQTTNDN